MRLHTLHCEMRGHFKDSPVSLNASCEKDIADEFAHLARLAGLEGKVDEHAGLWSTGYRYDHASLIRPDFRDSGLSLEVTCRADSELPLPPFFTCLQRVMDSLGTCVLESISLKIETYSARLHARQMRSHGLPTTTANYLASAGPEQSGGYFSQLKHSQPGCKSELHPISSTHFEKTYFNISDTGLLFNAAVSSSRIQEMTTSSHASLSLL